MKDRIESAQEEFTINHEDVWYCLDELKHLASVAHHLDADGPGEGFGPDYGLDWGGYRDNPDKEPEQWLDKELLPFLRVVSRRLTEVHKVFKRFDELAINKDVFGTREAKPNNMQAELSDQMSDDQTV